MKTLSALLLLTLICFLRHNCASALPFVPLECCKFSNRTLIPKAKVKHVAKTESGCRFEAIVVTTVCGKKFCLDKNWTWAVNLEKEFESRPNNKLSSAPILLCQKGQGKQ